MEGKLHSMELSKLGVIMGISMVGLISGQYQDARRTTCRQGRFITNCLGSLSPRPNACLKMVLRGAESPISIASEANLLDLLVIASLVTMLTRNCWPSDRPFFSFLIRRPYCGKQDRLLTKRRNWRPLPRPPSLAEYQNKPRSERRKSLPSSKSISRASHKQAPTSKFTSKLST